MGPDIRSTSFGVLWASDACEPDRPRLKMHECWWSIPVGSSILSWLGLTSKYGRSTEYYYYVLHPGFLSSVLGSWLGLTCLVSFETLISCRSSSPARHILHIGSSTSLVPRAQGYATGRETRLTHDHWRKLPSGDARSACLKTGPDKRGRTGDRSKAKEHRGYLVAREHILRNTCMIDGRHIITRNHDFLFFDSILQSPELQSTRCTNNNLPNITPNGTLE